MIYFDNAATTQTDNEVIDEMLKYFNTFYANPSSPHYLAAISHKALEDARTTISKTINAKEDEIIFTSGGTEADNLALNLITNCKGKHIITSKIEHPAILNTLEKLKTKGIKVSYIGVNEQGIIKLKELKKAISDETSLITIMYANNEIGTIQPVKEIGYIAKEHNIIFHTDAVQAYGQEYIDVKSENIDMLSASAHKFYGPKGIGFLYCRKGIKLNPQIMGGGQEKGFRSGTENVPAIAGMAKAGKMAMQGLSKNKAYTSNLRNYFIKRILDEIPFSRINGDKSNRLSGNISVSFQFINGQELLSILDLNEICASTGSACSSGKNKTSHVLEAIGLNEDLANSTIRFTISKNNTKDEIDYCIKILKENIEELRNYSTEYSCLKKSENNV